MTRPGDVWVNLQNQAVEFDDGARVREIRDSGSFIHAARSPWKVRPNTGDDMTSAIQAAFDQAPEGCTLVFDPGTYLTPGVTLSRKINIWAYGVTFDLGTSAATESFSPGIPENYNAGYLAIAAREAGTLTNLAGFIWGSSGGSRAEKNWIRGLKISRTAAANTAAARLYAGLVMLAPFECMLIDVSVDDFREGLVLLGGTAQGATYNFIENFKATDCRYPVTLYCNRTTGAGWVNQNTFRGGRLFITSTIRGDASWNEAQWEPIRLLWESGATGPANPNNNLFEAITLEGAFGRKVRCEGRTNGFIFNRYETVHSAGTPDITIGEASRTNSNFTRNIFMGGEDLPTILDNDNVEFLATVAINNGNTFYGGTANWFAARSDAVRANHRFTTTSSTAPVVAIGNANDIELIRLHHVYSALSAQGALEFQDSGETTRNAIGMETASPYDFAIQNGLKIAGVFRVRLDGSIDAIIANPQSGGDILFQLASGFMKLWGSASGNDLFSIADSNRDDRLVLKAQEVRTSTLTYLDVIKFFDDDATPTYMNAIGLHPSNNLGSQRPILIEYGMWINESLADADWRVSGDTETNLLYTDASTDRFGVGTATPDSRMHVVGKIHGSDELELDGALNHDGTTAGFFGTAPATQPTVTGSRGGNAALASLLTALAGVGLIVDSTTA